MLCFLHRALDAFLTATSCEFTRPICCMLRLPCEQVASSLAIRVIIGADIAQVLLLGDGAVAARRAYCAMKTSSPHALAQSATMERAGKRGLQVWVVCRRLDDVDAWLVPAVPCQPCRGEWLADRA